jgi:hypothetical protein
MYRKTKFYSPESQRYLEILQPWRKPNHGFAELEPTTQIPLPAQGIFQGQDTLSARVTHSWTFSQHTTLLLWLTFKVKTSGYQPMKESDKANSAALRLSKKMQFFISNRLPKSPTAASKPFLVYDTNATDPPPSGHDL